MIFIIIYIFLKNQKIEKYFQNFKNLYEEDNYKAKKLIL